MKCGLLARGQFNVIPGECRPENQRPVFGVLWAAHEAKYTDILIAEGLGKIKATGLARRLNCILKFERLRTWQAAYNEHVRCGGK